MEREASAPAPVWTIALLALAPFPVAAGMYAYGPARWSPVSLTGLLFWCSTVLSFLGGVRWGLESARPAPRWTRLTTSVMTSIVAWGLLMSRGRLGAVAVIGGFLAAFILQWLFDHQTPDTPSRYPMLSTAVTAGACVSLALCLEKAMHA